MYNFTTLIASTGIKSPENLKQGAFLSTSKQFNFHLIYFLVRKEQNKISTLLSIVYGEIVYRVEDERADSQQSCSAFESCHG